MLENNLMDAFENAREQIKKSCNLYDECKNSQNSYELISHPRRVIEVNIPVVMDDWKVKTFTWYRSQHNDSRWAFKWWIRFHQDVSKSEVKALSMWMTFKCAVADIPLGWWKWWIIVNPKDLSETELERLSRWYVRELYKYIGPDLDVPAPDVNTNPKIMAWMMDEYSKLVWKYSPASFTGKPISSGWSLWRDKATAQWWVFVLEEFARLKNMDLKWKKIIIQWAWNAGLTMAKLLEKKWTILVWIADSSWAIYDKNWLDLEKIINLKKSKKSLVEYAWLEKFSSLEILEKSCDILIPAALENQITKQNASNIKANIILELANGPVDHEADEILFESWITVIPDILANAGWVVVSYFEWVQNTINYYWDLEEVDEKLAKKMRKASLEVYEASKKYNTHTRNWAYIVSMKRVFSAMKNRGEI